jgi:predicted nucleotidyltransferase
LYNDHADLLEDPDFDYVLAGACLLGRDLATISNEDMREILADIMREIIEGDGDQLFVYRSAESGASIDKAASYLRAIYQELST